MLVKVYCVGAVVRTATIETRCFGCWHALRFYRESVLGLRRRWLSLMVFAEVETPAFLLHSVGIPAIVELPQIKKSIFGVIWRTA